MTMKHIDNYIHFGLRSKYLNDEYNTLIEKDENTYTGNMFRAIGISKQKIKRNADIRILMSSLHKYHNSYPFRRVFAWSKRIGNENNGMMAALKHQRDICTMHHQGIVLQQNTIGLDVNKIFMNNPHHTHFFQREEEVLANMSNTINVYGFWKENEVFTYDEFFNWKESV